MRAVHFDAGHIAAALLYGSEEDTEAARLAGVISEKGYRGALQEVSGL